MTTKNKLKPVEKIDPTLPFTEIEILGKTYKMCFTFRAILKGDAGLRRQGVDSRLLWTMPSLSFENVPIVLAAALATFHPELSFEDVVDLLDWDTIFEVRDKIADGWLASFPKRAEGEKNPPEPVQS